MERKKWYGRPALGVIPSVLSAIAIGCGTPAEATPMTFDVIYLNHTNVIVADGEITSDTPSAFRAFLDSGKLDGFNLVIHLNSPGGNLYGGMELGRMIRKARLTSEVLSYSPRRPGEEFWSPMERPGLCASACALAFLGGERRHLAEGSILGFHQFSGGDSDDIGSISMTQAQTQLVSGELLEYITGMGVSPKLFSKLSSALPQEMFVPTRPELEDLDILSRNAFRGFTLEPTGDGVIAYATFPENVEGRQQIGQVTAYCKQKSPYILLSLLPGARPMDEWQIANLVEENGGFRIFQDYGGEAVYPAENVTVRHNGPGLIEARIDQKGIVLIENGARLYFEVPAVVGMYGGTIAPSKADVKLLRSAFRLCIS